MAPYNVSSRNKPAFTLLSSFPCLFSHLWNKKRKTLSTVKSSVTDFFVIRKNEIISSVLQFAGKMYLHSKIMSPFTLRPEIPVSCDGVSINGLSSDHIVILFFCFHITNSTLGNCIPHNKILLLCWSAEHTGSLLSAAAMVTHTSTLRACFHKVCSKGWKYLNLNASSVVKTAHSCFLRFRSFPCNFPCDVNRRTTILLIKSQCC